MIELNKIYNMDCFDFLKEVKTGSVDLVLIDPPYEVSRDTNFAKGDKKGTDVDRFRVSMDFGEWDKDFTGLDMVIKDCYRILRKGGTLICFYDLWKITNLKDFFEQGKFKQIRFIEWLKTNPVPINSNINYLTNSREIALLGIKDSKPTFNSKYDNGVYEYPDDEIYQNPNHGIYRYPICHDKGRFHPTQKPVKLIEELVLKHSDEGDIVLDCFIGSGTTAIACINTNRQFLGCELDPTYYAIAEERIKKAKQNKLLKILEV